MAHPIREMAKMTTRTKQIDGMGFGGSAPDNLEIAGALGMPNPNTGKKLHRHPYYLARFLYCDDTKVQHLVKAGLLVELKAKAAVTDIVLVKLINCALREAKNPRMRLNRETGKQEVKAISKSELCRQLSISGNKLPDTHNEAYNAITDMIYAWNDDVIRHVNLHLNKDAAQY